MNSEHVEQVKMAHLLLLPECEETNARYFHNLEAHTRNITFGLTATTKTRDEDFIVLVNEIQATVILAHQRRSAT